MAACQTRLGPDRQCRRAGRRLPIRPPELGCELGIEQGEREGKGVRGGRVTVVAGESLAWPGPACPGSSSCSWHCWPKPLLIINLGSSDKKRRVSTFPPRLPPSLPGSCSGCLSPTLSLSLCPLLHCILAPGGLSLLPLAPSCGSAASAKLCCCARPSLALYMGFFPVQTLSWQQVPPPPSSAWSTDRPLTLL